MREIKFRAWHKELEDMIYYPEPYRPLANLFEFSQRYPDMYFLMQYTGLKDKNNRDIYEGDIILIHSFLGDEEQFNVPVIFKDGMFMAEGTGILSHTIEMNNGVIIGNIYENPELLK